MTYIPQLNAITSTGNSTSAPLNAYAVFSGVGEDVSQYTSVAVSVWASVGGTIDLQFSTNNTNWDANQFFSVTSGRSFVLPVKAQFFRVVYTNGPLGQGTFRLQTILHKAKSLSISSQLNTPIAQDELAVVTRSVITGLNGNDFQNARVSEHGELSIAINDPISTFDEVATFTRRATIQMAFDYIINPALVNTTLIGGATATQANSMAVLSTSAAISTSVTITSDGAVRARPGQEVVAILSGVFTLGIAGSEQLLGAANTDNGFFFGYNGASFGVMRRSNSVDTWVAQSAWNIDPLDGTGPSGMVLDTTQGNMYRIAFSSGFVGTSYQIYNPVEAKFITVHIASYIASVPVLGVASLNLWCQAQNTSNATDIILKVANASAFTDQVLAPLGVKGVVDNVKLSVGTTLTNIISIRSKATFAGKANYIGALLMFYSGAADGNQSSEIELVFNGVLGGTPVWNDYDPLASVMEVDTAGTTVTGGRRAFANLIAATGSFGQDLSFLQLIINAGDMVTVAGKASQANTDLNVSIIWIEDI
ncbi:MAG: hypothetical protein ACC707_03045 [Thiohalomonadales bacterium]